MTDNDWLTATDPTPMLEFSRGKVSDRKLRLFAVVCNREYNRNRSLLSKECISVQYVDLTERFADGEVTAEVWNEFRQQLLFTFHDREAFSSATLGIRIAVALCHQHISNRSEAEAMQLTFLACIMREIFGNPFRPVPVDPRWQTETVIALAAGIYEDRAFERMPILADALQEAGCENEQVLQHCREPGQHVRGCWVVDLLLGKQ